MCSRMFGKSFYGQPSQYSGLHKCFLLASTLLEGRAIVLCFLGRKSIIHFKILHNYGEKSREVHHSAGCNPLHSVRIHTNQESPLPAGSLQQSPHSRGGEASTLAVFLSTPHQALGN